MAFCIFPLWGIDWSDGSPTCTCYDGKACTNAGKHPKVAWKRLEKGEDAAKGSDSYGIATGYRSGFFVVDTDIKPGVNGESLLQSLGQLPPTRTVLTGSGGKHRYFKLPDGFAVKTCANIDGHKGIDIRGEGGYVVGPGSERASGTRYELVDDSPIADAPEWLLGLLRASGEARVEGSAESAIARGEDHPDFGDRVLRAVAYLQNKNNLPRDTKQGGTTMFKVALTLVRSLELPIDVCERLIENEYNPRLKAMGATEWQGQRLRKKLNDARDNGQKPTGTEVRAFEEAPATPDFLEPQSVDEETGEVTGSARRKFDIAQPYVGKTSKIGDVDFYLQLRTHPSWENVWRHNAFTESPWAYDAPLHCGLIAEKEGGLHKEDMTRIKLWFESVLGSIVTIDQVMRTVPAVALENRYHPVRDYLESLPKHRGASNFDGLSQRIFGSENPLHDVFLRKWMIAAAKRIISPGCKVDNILVLFGGQGLGKSTFFKVLAGGSEFFLDGMKDVTSKDAQDQLEGKWIIEFDELQVMDRTSDNVFKGFVTRTHEVYRKAFATDKRSRPRQCIFGGTTNDPEIVRDPTGGRRYWIIPVEKMIDEALLWSLRDRLWSEAFSAAKSGEQHWLTCTEAALAEEGRVDYTAVDDWDGPVASYIMGKDFAKSADIYRMAICGGDEGAIAKMDVRVTKRLANIMRKLGWYNGTKKFGKDVERGWHATKPGSQI